MQRIEHPKRNKPRPSPSAVNMAVQGSKGTIPEMSPCLNTVAPLHTKNKGDNSRNIPFKHRGTSAQHRIARLKRDHPDVAKRLMAGEFKTVADASKSACNSRQGRQGRQQSAGRATVGNCSTVDSL